MTSFDDLPAAPDPRARDAAHHASQLVAAAGVTMLEPDPAFHYSSTILDPEEASLVGAELPDGRRVRLSLCDLVLTIGAVELPLLGKEPKEAAEWLSDRLGRSLRFPEWEMPNGPTLEQPRWGVSKEDLGHLAHWFTASHRIFARFEPGVGQASGLRVWPHHFDLATLVTIEASDDPEKVKSVGLGMTPGDGGIAQPYLYVTPWPYPASPPTPPLPSGRWNTQGWVGAVLEASDVGSDAQVAAFLRTAFDHSVAMLG